MYNIPFHYEKDEMGWKKHVEKPSCFSILQDLLPAVHFIRHPMKQT